MADPVTETTETEEEITEVTTEENGDSSETNEDQGTTEETTEENSEETPEKGSEETTEETPDTPSLDKFQSEFEENQSLSDESYDELAEMGYDRDMVDAYIRGATTVLSADEADALIEDFGGQEAFDTMRDWAGKNLTVAELETFNGALQTKASSEMAMTWLKGKMEDAEGFDPKVNLSGSPAGTPKADVFTRKEEVKAVIRDKRWAKDKAWTREMEAKIGRSKLF